MYTTGLKYTAKYRP